MMLTQAFKLKESEEICIIDDSPAPMAITKKICERILPHVPIKTFPNVDSAITYLTTVSIQTRRTIFLDLYMPEKDGWCFLEAYTPTPLDAIYILSSSDAESDLSKARLHTKVKDYLMKPLTMATISGLLYQ
ncbi:MAG: response regulator [Bacteroidota bacterium]